MLRRMLVRDRAYLENYGVYLTQADVTCELSEPIARSARFSLERVTFDEERGKIVPVGVTSGWEAVPRDEASFTLAFELEPGYYLLRVKNGQDACAMPIVVHDPARDVDVAVVRPVFTQWSYHWEGFYFNECPSFADRVLARVGGAGLAGRAFERAARAVARRFDIGGVDFPYEPFPAHESVSLKGFYRRNRRWDKTFWDADLGALEGLWCDELLSQMPLFALLDRLGVSYRVFTDVDMHRGNEELEKFEVLVFSGQEGITVDYQRTLERLQRGGPRFLLWGVQGFGYRQLHYDERAGELRYICTRGRSGLWGDELEEWELDWGDEARMFGFHFPEPSSADWRSGKPYSHVVVTDREHPVAVHSKTAGKTFTYEVADAAGIGHPGLTWAGGEVQRRVAEDARVIAHLDDDEEIVGIGEYRNTLIFAPTYLPAFFGYQAGSHPEVEAWFRAALDHLRGGGRS